jgi:hypothetical protein
MACSSGHWRRRAPVFDKLEGPEFSSKGSMTSAKSQAAGDLIERVIRHAEGLRP